MYKYTLNWEFSLDTIQYIRNVINLNIKSIKEEKFMKLCVHKVLGTLISICMWKILNKLYHSAGDENGSESRLDTGKERIVKLKADHRNDQNQST